MQHSIALLQAAKVGKASFRADLYDGSEKGEKVYDTVSIIGRRRPPGANQQLPRVKNVEALDGLAAWPVSIGYFEPGSDKTDAVPVYELTFLFFENGVSRKLFIDYGEFAIRGELKEITFHPPSKCEQKSQVDRNAQPPTTQWIARADGTLASRLAPQPRGAAHAAGIAPRGGLTTTCGVLGEHVGRHQRRQHLVEVGELATGRRPARSHRGSKMLTTWARPRASRLAWRSSVACAAASPAAARAAISSVESRVSRRPRVIGLEAGPGHPGLHAAHASAPALGARVLVGAPPRAAGCGPTRRRCRADRR